MTANFQRAEFACRCCGWSDPDPALVAGLQALRDAIGKPIVITSGCRCIAHNAKVGGAMRSLHTLGKAADIIVRGMTASELFEAAVKVPQLRGFGVDSERNMLHVDVRDDLARWSYAGGRVVPFAV